MAKVTLTNERDLGMVERGVLPPEGVRTEAIEALVDTGAMSLALPADVVERLGLSIVARKTVTLATGERRDVGRTSAVRVEILGRDTICDALVLPVGATPLVGQIPLEGLDLVVDPASGEARPNPAHPDGPVYDLLAAG